MPPSRTSHDIVTPSASAAASGAPRSPAPAPDGGELRAHARGRHAPARSGWLRRLVVLPIGLVGVAAGCLIPWHDAVHSGVFDDTFWHRAAGVWMLDHHRVIRTDVFSYTVAGHSWVSPEWGYDVVLAQSVRSIGPVAFWLLSAGLATVTVLAVAVRSRLVGAGWTWTGLLCVEAGAAITVLLDDRPQMVSYFFLALLLLLLTAGRRHRAWLVAVPVMFVLWANLHGSFLLGLAILVLEVVASMLRRYRGRVAVADALGTRAALLTLVVSGLATLVNPFGTDVYASAFGVTFNSTVRQLVTEWQSPNFHDPVVLAVVMVPVAVTVAYLAFSARPVPGLELALAAFLLVSALDATRFIAYFAIAWCALAARCSPIPVERLRPNVVVLPLVAVLSFSFLHGPWYPAGKPAASVPVSAVAYLERHPGRVFSTYLWSDYLDWVGRPVFVDGRTELYTDNGVLSHYLAIDELTADPDPVLAAHHVTYVLWPTHDALAVYLAHDPHWRVVWRSSSAVVLRAT